MLFIREARHLPPLPTGSLQRYHLPRPVILDSHLRLPLDCKLLKNHRDGCGRRPWIIGTRPQSEAELVAWQARHTALEAAGAKIVEVPGQAGTRF